MIDKVIDTIKSNNMFDLGDKVVVAVSGGPDSICLLHILYKLKEKLGISLVVSHINHCLRGKESDKDEEYVEDFCENLGIECFVKREDVHKISKEKGISCEMAGREVRYDFFIEVMNKVNANKIAVAHNANDQAETVLMRILRGTGLEGLVGIKAIRDDTYVRPTINSTRKEIEDYCSYNNLKPRIDKTNLENIYTRNKIRLELIPYIEKNFNSDIIQVLNRFSDTVKIDNEYMNKVSSELYAKYCKRENDRVIITREAFKEHEAILTRIIRGALKEVKGNLYNVDKNHIYDIIHIQKNSTGKTIMLPNGIRVLNSYGNIQLYIVSMEEKIDTLEKEYGLNVNTKSILKDINLNISLEVINNQEGINFDKGSFIKYFDYDKINGNIKLRYKKNGDRFTPLGMKGSKKIKDFFINLKIPQNERGKIPFVVFGNEIAWIVGYRISDKFKVDKSTRNILKIKIEREE